MPWAANCEPITAPCELLPLGTQGCDVSVDACELVARLREARIERVEPEQCAARLRREGALMPFQRCRVLRSRQGRAEQNRSQEREPEREAALPSTTHGG